MAAVIGDFVPDLSRFHSMISSSASIQQQQHQGQQHSSHDPSAPAYRSSSRNRPSSAATAAAAAAAAPRSHKPDTATQPQLQPSSSSSGASRPAQQGQGQVLAGQSGGVHSTSSSTGGASRFPSPPPSSSPTAAPGPAAVEHGSSASMAPHIGDGVSSAGRAQTNPADNNAARRQQPSPPDDFQIAAPGPGSGSYLVASSAASQRIPHQNIVHLRDLAHIESLVQADTVNGGAGTGILQDPPMHQVKYEISGMPIGDIIEMVAALLTKITTTNDLQHDAMQRNVAHQQQASQNADAGGSSQMSPLSHSVLAFHGKNVPAITILSYLSRIHKYCPTTYEVFLSLLVYFDRMTERVNDLVLKGEEAKRQATPRSRISQSTAQPQDTPMRELSETRGSDESDSDLADDDDDEDEEDDDMVDSPAAAGRREVVASAGTLAVEHPAASPSATYFVVDSFNIHRLIIAGVTCASKFFSDVFYTNSRYAKVGGLPLAELNHLELQFLVLNDFRLAVPVEDLEAYATMLVEFYAREVVAPKNGRPTPQ
ncbi:PHO85 cyclin-6 [Cladobotryum mycophilum]|uniref:PHO85 cyclin-6 n=1 Tax=Cladobotryum mycophilum TaxID=491253 RepID=A0ABR0SAK9_9HYPO